MVLLGAIQVDNDAYILPCDAEKGKLYKCIGCQQKVILKKGNVRKIHFAHHSQTNTCYFFEHPNESEIHKVAKYKLYSWLKNKKPIIIGWSCCKPHRYNNYLCGVSEGDMEHEVVYAENDEIIVEYRDVNNKYVADVAVINKGVVKYIFEIKHTHSTVSNVRPEPWFEIKAQEIFEEEEKYGPNLTPKVAKLPEEFDDIDRKLLTCIRNHKKRYCSRCSVIEEEWVNELPQLYCRYGSERGWIQENPCIKCGRKAYNPVFCKGYKQICKICISSYEYELKNEYSVRGKCYITL
jgi:hypothetical protein